MATWKCKNCGAEKEARCKPKKCSQCGAQDSFEKVEVKK